MVDEVGGQLLPDERVLWRGRPSAELVIRPIDLFQIPFSLVWCGMAVSPYVRVWRMDGDPLQQLFGLLFVIAGLSLAAGRLLVDIHLRKHIVYLVTDRRIVIDRRGAWPSTKSFDVGRLPEIELEERPSGSGTIRFGTARGWLDPNDFGTWQPALDPRPQFIRLPEARSVYDLTQRQSRA